ncbi:acetoacetate decarboxylase [Rhodobacteraceae bacterium]|nr:acetoacetate decarboxylase [Paracoccaceae bacterium]
MDLASIKKNAFSMPLTNPSYPKGPYRFIDREFFIVTYRTDMDALRAVVPEPLKVIEPIVKYEFIRMPDSTGFGDYTESGQVIPVEFEGRKGGYVHSMYLNDHSPIAGGREIWGFPKKMAEPNMRVEKDTLVGTLHYGSVEIAAATMGYKHRTIDIAKVAKALAEPSWLIKIIPDVCSSKARVCELVEYYLEDVTVKGAWEGPAGLELRDHAMANLTDLPVREVLSATHIQSDLTLGLGKVVYDYLA